MGCFNHKGNFSQLPITYGDRIVVIVGVTPVPADVDIDNFAPGGSFVPVSVPIRGIYNDYGGIENVDMTPAVKVLEEFFGLEVTKIVDAAERTMCGCEDQLEDIIGEMGLEGLKKAMDTLFKKDDILMRNKVRELGGPTGLSLSYMMEHERIFDHIVAVGNPTMADKEWWRIPHTYIEMLGYRKNVIGENNHYPVILWESDGGLPTLKEECYVWLEKDFGQMGKVSNTISELCTKIGCFCGDKFNEKFLENIFRKEAAENPHPSWEVMRASLLGMAANPDAVTDDELEKISNKIGGYRSGGEFGYTFGRHTTERGLFGHRDGIYMPGLILAQFGEDDEHLNMEYMKEVVEVAALLDGLEKLQMTWGVTNYYRQDVDYNTHILFLQECMNVATDKEYEHGYEEESC